MHFFNPRAGDAAARGHRRRASPAEAALERRPRRRRGDGQARDRRRRRPRLPRQPLQPAVRPRGAALLAERVGRRRADRPHLPARRRLPDGAVRADGPRRGRRRLRGRASRSTSVASASRAGARRRSRRAWSPPGRHGRKTGRGWYDYRGRPAPARRPGAARPPAAATGGVVVSPATAPLAEELRAPAASAGYGRAAEPSDAEGEVPWLIVDCGAEPSDEPAAAGRPAGDALRRRARCAALDPAAARPASTRCRRSRRAARRADARPDDSDGRRGRARRALLRDASAATSSGSATRRGSCSGGSCASSSTRRRSRWARASARAEDIDAGMVLGLNYPRGPLALGATRSASTTCSPCSTRSRTSTARSATAPRRCCGGMALGGRLGHATGAGFFDTT